MNDRKVKILDLLAAHKKIKTTLLAELLDVSQVTLRRDLDNLEMKGMICRTHGYAGLTSADSTGKRMAINYSIKRRIAKAAAKTIDEGETVMLESGSCCALFAEELAVTGKNITIITNSVFIANYIHKLSNVKIILLGGFYQPESQVMVGPLTVKCGDSFYADKYFLGADGYIPGYGFTGRDHLRVDTAKELTKYTKDVFILTDAAKFNRRGTISLIQFNKLSGVFTDDSIPKEAEADLTKNNVHLYKVPSVDEKLKSCQFPGHPPVLYSEKDL